MNTVVSPPFSASVQFFGGSVATPYQTPKTLKIAQAEYHHDVIEMEFWGGDVNSQALSSGVPIIISWGRPSFQRTIYGYVNHAGRNSTYYSDMSLMDRNSLQVVCFGASWAMKEAGTMVFASVTIPQVIQMIASYFGLDSSVVPHSTVWPSLPMAGRSFWKFCSDLCQRIGYTFFCNGLQLVARPRQTSGSNINNVAAVYDFKKDPASFPVFRPVLGANSPIGGELRNRTVAGIDPRSMQTIYTTVSGSPSATKLGQVAEPPVFDALEHFSIDSQSEALAKTQGAGALNQMYISAKAQLSGNAQIGAGSLIFAQNANGSQDGLWFATKIIHELDEKKYLINADLGRDSIGPTTSISILPQTQELTKARLVAQTWRAA